MYIERRYVLRAPAKNRTLKKPLRFRLVALARLAFLHHFPVVVNAARLLDGPLCTILCPGRPSSSKPRIGLLLVWPPSRSRKSRWASKVISPHSAIGWPSPRTAE